MVTSKTSRTSRTARAVAHVRGKRATKLSAPLPRKKSPHARSACPARRNFTGVVSEGRRRVYAAEAIIMLKGVYTDMKNIRQAGFTLIELALVIAAVSGIAAIVLPAVQ